MIGAEVEPQRHFGSECPDRLKLKGTDLRHEEIPPFLPQQKLGHRRADVATCGGTQSGTSQHPRRELGGGRLAIGPRDGDNRNRA